MEENQDKKIQEFIEKASNSKKGKLDLSSDEDLSIAVMNLISIEEHFFFTASKTENPEYYTFLAEIREMRKELLKKLIKEYEGEVWCISKHLLAGSMRLMEVGTKYLGQGDDKEAHAMFKKAYDLYSLFWAMNLKLIKTEGVKKIADDEINNQDKEKGKKGFGKFGDLVKRLVDCCIE